MIDIDYISGFFDADGSITLGKNQKSAIFKTIKIDFTNVELSILQEIQNYLTEQGITSSLSVKPARKKSHCISYALSINSTNNCLRLCKMLKSKHPKKRHRINTVLKYHKKVTLRNGKYNERQKQRRLAYERLFFFPTFQ